MSSDIPSKEEAGKRAEKLREIINDLRYRYHVLDDPSVSDDVYDSLTRELRAIEEKYPALVTPDSPTQRVGGQPLDKFRKVTHIRPMLSLNDVFSWEELESWHERNKKIVPSVIQSRFYCEMKVDGLACSLIYRDGLLVRAATRGDGRIGEDVTENIKTIHAIPLRLRRPLVGQVEVRGEVFMPCDSFTKLNETRQAQGLPEFANPRNAAAGAVRQLDPKLTAERDLSFVAYQMILPKPARYHHMEHDELEELGFKANSKHNKIAEDLSAVMDYIHLVERRREKLPYQIDGVVVQLDDREIFDRLGITGKAPRGAVAYKFAAREATTRLLDIVVQVGRQGTLTPVAVLEPVEVGGVTVSRATLHNEDEIERRGVLIGDTVIVRRAGDVIPEVVGPVEQLRSGREKRFHFPKNCPVCGEPVYRVEGEVAYRCNNRMCLGSRVLQLRHFTSKAAFDIVGLGPRVIDRLYDAGLISDQADIFQLKAGDIAQLEGFGEQSAENIINAINESRKVSLRQFIYSLGIRHVGVETAEALAKHFGSLESVRHSKLEELQKVRDIGPIVAKSIADYFSREESQHLVDRLLKEVEVQTVRPDSQAQGPLRGKSIVFTGTLGRFSREEAQEAARRAGADVNESVSKNTDLVVVGENPGLKAEKARRLGVTILSEPDFLKLINR